MSRNEFTTASQHVIAIIFPWFDRFYRQGRRLLINLISGGAKLRNNRWTRDRVKLLQSPYFFRPTWPPPPLPTVILYSPQFRSHQENKMAAPLDSTIVIYDLTEKYGTANSLLSSLCHHYEQPQFTLDYYKNFFFTIGLQLRSGKSLHSGNPCEIEHMSNFIVPFLFNVVKWRLTGLISK